MTDLGALGLGGPGTFDHSFASGNNDNGQIVGRDYLFSETESKAFLWSGGTMTSLDAILGGGFSSALDINNLGQIVGLRGVPPDISSWSAFRYDTATNQVTSLPGLGGTFRISAVAINDAGEAVGYSSTVDPNVFHAVKWTTNVPSDLGTLGGTHSFANGIGQVVGQSWIPGDSGTHAFLWNGGPMQDLGTLGGGFSSANAINVAGEVVGTASTASNETHAFIFEGGVMSDLNDRTSASSGFVLVEATMINASGEIVGHGLVGGELHAFLLTPSTPPPDLASLSLSVPADFTVEALDLAGSLRFLCGDRGRRRRPASDASLCTTFRWHVSDRCHDGGVRRHGQHREERVGEIQRHRATPVRPDTRSAEQARRGQEDRNRHHQRQRRVQSVRFRQHLGSADGGRGPQGTAPRSVRSLLLLHSPVDGMAGDRTGCQRELRGRTGAATGVRLRMWQRLRHGREAPGGADRRRDSLTKPHTRSSGRLEHGRQNE